MPSKNVTGSLGSGELTPVEWKQSLSEIKEMTETAVAFANTAGRCIFVGVSLQGKVLGVQNCGENCGGDCGDDEPVAGAQ